jgi:glutamate/aspartate transport system substrate-binding protein
MIRRLTQGWAVLAAAPLLLFAWLLSAPAWSQDDDPVLTGTLKTIDARGTILIGYRETAPPFSFLNPGKQPVGFSLDLCHGIAEDVAKTLNRDLLDPGAPAWQTGIRIVMVPVAADERLPKIMSGAIDLECGSTTDNMEREKQVAFSPVFFLAGTKLLVPLVDGAPAIPSYRALAGKTVVVGAGTTNAAVLHRLAPSLTPPLTVQEVPDLDSAYAALAAGKAAAFASDDILLAGFVATKPDGHNFGVTGDYLSFEPYAIGFRRNDPDFAALVHHSFARMASEGTLYALYRRWLIDTLPNGERMNLPISPQLAEMYRVLGQPD